MDADANEARENHERSDGIRGCAKTQIHRARVELTAADREEHDGNRDAQDPRDDDVLATSEHIQVARDGDLAFVGALDLFENLAQGIVPATVMVRHE